MSSNILDRRVSGKNKSSTNRQRFIRRVNKHVRDAIRENIKNGSIRDIVNTDEQDVIVPKKDINEPSFRHKRGGDNDRVYPGNKEYTAGDRIPKPYGGGSGGSGSGTGGAGEGEDEFHFMISKKEYMDIFFEDLALPDLVKKHLSVIAETKLKRAGYAVDGIPSRLNYVRSLKESVGRRAALRNPKKRKLRELEDELADLLEYVALNTDYQGVQQKDCSDEQCRMQDLAQQITAVKRKIKAVPFIDEIDLRYNRFEVVTIPTTQAVMFMLMDVSGSMDEFKKEMAKRFYMLLYVFLNRTYEHIDIVPIRYHTTAKEVDEEEFFYSKDTGGTLVSPSLSLAKQIMEDRYDSTWNIYFCQASDGDNEVDDTHACVKLLNKILPNIQYYAYIQIGDNDNVLSRMFESYLMGHTNMNLAFIDGPEDIFPVFRKLFDKESA